MTTQAVAWPAFATAAIRKSKANGPKGMGIPNIYARNSNGNRAMDPISWQNIPKPHAVKVGRRVYDARSLRQLFAHNPRATNPYTREPFPEEVMKKYSPQAYAENHALNTALILVGKVQRFGRLDSPRMQRVYTNLSRKGTRISLLGPQQAGNLPRNAIMVEFGKARAFVYFQPDLITPKWIWVFYINGAMRNSHFLRAGEIQQRVQHMFS